MDEWFRWEREATIHLLFPTLEGSMKPLEEFTGYGFPTTILNFKNGLVTWCVKNTEFYGLGAKLLGIYKDYKREQEMVVEANKRLISKLEAPLTADFREQLELIKQGKKIFEQQELPIKDQRETCPPRAGLES